MTSNSADLLQELAERLVSTPHPTFPAATPRIHLIAGATPDNLPFDLPRPPETRLLGSVLRPADAGISADIVYATTATPEAVVAVYDEQLTAKGWMRAPSTDPLSRSGFQSTMTLPVYRYSQGEAGPSLSVTILAPVEREHEVRVHVETVRSPQPRPRVLRGEHMLPRLSPPHSVFLTPGSFSSSDYGASSFASAHTELSALALASHFEPQLAAAGWQRRDGGTNGALAWSSWSLPQPDSDSWEGLLYVVEEPLGAVRWLHLRTSASGWEGPLHSGGGVWLDMRAIR